MSPGAKEIFTIGYERSGLSAFLETLKAAGVAMVIDVRDLPLSRRAGFSKRTLAASLAAEGLGYVHLKPLGTPKEGRLANHRREWDRFWAIVEAQLATPEAEEAFEQAAKLARAAPCCLLCFEADPQTCHRREVAAELERRFGFTIWHLRVEERPVV
jgi:uncharacterized protein (DUF488 family)